MHRSGYKHHFEKLCVYDLEVSNRDRIDVLRLYLQTPQFTTVIAVDEKLTKLILNE